ncbi:MAG: ribulose-phosphate 3-epimerase [Candidatus Omnitrophota bacterium]
MDKKILVAPSILSADFSELRREIKKVEDSGADMIHVDVMDGHFVPNITIGPLLVKAARRCTGMILDVHLMIENPHLFIKDFAEAGSDIITIHAEAYERLQGDRVAGLQGLKKGQSKTAEEIDEKRITEVLRQIKSHGKKAGISINPGSPLCIRDVLNETDMVLFMSVHPGFGGQEFIREVLSKIKELRKIYNGDIEVDGGINEKTAKDVVDAGANILVAGSYFFGAKDPKEAVRKLRS